MKTIITIQHTQSVHHTNGMVGSWTDWELTELGREQAEKIGEKLAREIDGSEDVMYSSDLLRAKQTAEIVGRYLGLAPRLRTELREINAGCACGKSVEWLRENAKTEVQTIDDRLFPDAESRRDEWNRLVPFFDEIMNNAEEKIIIVSHGNMLSVFNSMFLGLEAESLNNGDMHGSAGGVSKMIVSDDGKRYIKRISDMSYIV